MRPIHRRVLMALVAVLGVLGASAMAVLAANVKPDFAIAGAPTSQTVVAGQSIAYTITVARAGGYSEAVTPSVSGLPRDATASFAPTPITGTSSTLTIETRASTPAGTYPLSITGVGRTLTRSTAVQLVVQPSTQPKFTFSAAPTTQTVVAKESAAYAITLNRSGGFAGAVSMTANGLPTGATAAFAPATVPASAA